MAAYYNEFDPYAAQWLRNLISAGHIAPGVVDERSIKDVRPDDLREFTQCHFFAGVGVWSYALRLAGWPDDRPVWTGSCPCQPFSAAGQGAGFDDERHLWPDFHWLIQERNPAVVFGEQVASKNADPWVDLVHADLEAMGYAFGAVPFPSAGVGAPHIRDRLFWVADANSLRREGLQRESSGGLDRRNDQQRALLGLGSSGEAGRMADSVRTGSLPSSHAGVHRSQKGAGARDGEPKRPGAVGGLGNSRGAGLEERIGLTGMARGATAAHEGEALERAGIHPGAGRAGPVNGLWRDADWLFCRDGKWRPVEPGTFPLAHGAASRVGRLRAYGNAINVEAAKEFIAAYMETQQ